MADQDEESLEIKNWQPFLEAVYLGDIPQDCHNRQHAEALLFKSNLSAEDIQVLYMRFLMGTPFDLNDPSTWTLPKWKDIGKKFGRSEGGANQRNLDNLDRIRRIHNISFLD